MRAVTRDGSDLCLRCGMCCDGTLFASALLKIDDEGDFDIAERQGLEPIRSEAGPRFKQPCPRFVDGCCSVYRETRPAVCGDYHCALLVDYISGRRDLDTCLDILSSLRVIVRRLEEEMGLLAGEFTLAWLANYAREAREHGQPDDFARLHLMGDRYIALCNAYVHFNSDYRDLESLLEMIDQRAAVSAD